MTLRLPIGFSDFAQIRGQGMHYVDKSALAADVVRSDRQVMLFPRPRRFGKTLNLTMLRAFFERGEPDQAALFAGLEVQSAGPEVLSHMGAHPVVYLTFKDVKHASWADCLEALGGVLAEEVERHRALLAQAGLAEGESGSLHEIASRKASAVGLQQTLKLLTRALAQATGQQAVVLIDEYDTPIHAAFAADYYDQAVVFFRNFLSAGLKDNPHLYRGVITGILRVAKESLFSGLNNVDVHSVLSAQFGDRFGFTETEVAALAEGTGQPEALPMLRDWYNGYQIGGARIYNPWSVLSQLVRPGAPPQPWWVNTASDEILRELLIGAGLGIHDDLAALIRGESIVRPISEEIVLRDVRQDSEALWSFLLFCGYLTAERPQARDTFGRLDTPLRVPNREVSTVYRYIFQSWLRRALSVQSDAPQRLARALLSGDVDTFRALLSRLVLEALSFYDVGGRRPEAVYQAFIVGLLVQLEATHEVRSNRESGMGRYDILVRPRQAGQPGAVLELKVVDSELDETPDVALDRAMTQVRSRGYATELHAGGASPAWQWAAVFDGKRAWVRAELSDG